MIPEFNRGCNRHHRILLIRIVITNMWFLLALASFAWPATPPFFTDDPDPVEYRHWEFYLASQYRQDRHESVATAPHLEINYGALPDLQIHLIVPSLYVKPRGEKSQYGYGDTELGFKYRLVAETDWRPMVGIAPLLELPTGDEARRLGNGDPQVFLPLWLQKSWSAWTTHGGGGYWFNPGPGHQDFWFIGWAIYRKINDWLVAGVEVFHKSASSPSGDSDTGFNAAACFDLTAAHHVLLAVGRDFSGPNQFSSYFAYHLTFGP